ncbi:MAG: glycogen debranching enzyme family protein [Anaerolineae bacterium]|nr:glycogen debranching enzyme family protein [Anaerolineae bacterium]
MLDFGREICTNLNEASQREWLVTNGIGGYASGTVAGILTRRYHGLLIAALNPPVGRTLLLSKLEETVNYRDRFYDLSANQWVSGAIQPEGFRLLERFHLEGAIPVWTYRFEDLHLEKRIWMTQGTNTTYIRYDFLEGQAPLTLVAKILVNYRDHHRTTRAVGQWMRVEPVGNGLRIVASNHATPFYVCSCTAKVTTRHEWYRDFFLSQEAYRGLDRVEDHLNVGDCYVTLHPGESVAVAASTEATPLLDSDAALEARRTYETHLLEQAALGEAPPEVRRLVLAADQFIVRRDLPDEPDGRTVIAGYPWFGDWGRDTMIALPGLTLTTGQAGVARRILKTFAGYVDQGMLPNNFPEADETPGYNTVDATLWYFEALRAYHDATGDDDLLRELFPILQTIIAWHRQGTRYRIHVDPQDGLLYAGEPGAQLTWMDAKVGDWVVTARVGKPVEVNALWYNALCTMTAFAKHLGEPFETYATAAARVREHFSRFWNAGAGYCYDVIDTPAGNDPALRPNQIFAVSLPYSPLAPEQQRAVVDVCAEHLLTPHGLRSLAKGQPGFIGHYGGDQTQRDGAYHQGTVWAWLIGAFVEAHLRVYNDPVQARAFLEPLFRHLDRHGVGSISEIFDGDAPYTPRGAIAQAWSVAEVLRIWRLLQTYD